MRSRTTKGIAVCLAALMTVPAVSGCQDSGISADGKVNLSFQIWDVAQRDGMQAIIDAYQAQNPNVTIELQVTSWDEYWTKLDAAAESNQLPDIFWMHTNQILKYADYGMLADVTSLYDDEDPNYYTEHFSEISLDNAKGSDGRIYGVPKDKDTVCLAYNRELFDQAGVAYPDETWTWDTLCEASAQIYEKTGKYGYMAYADEQLGYWNFVYQAGGSILNEDKTAACFTDPATKKGMEFYINLQKEPWCPDQNYFAETAPGNAFMSGQGAMYLEGNWNLMSLRENNAEMEGKWDVAVLPKCPDPVNGDGRATISNGLCYSTGAHGKKLEYALDFLKFCGSEEGQRVQGLSGAAIPAYIGLEDTWVSAFDKFDYDMNVEKCVEMFDYGVQSVNNASRPNWKTQVNDLLLKIYSGSLTLDEGLAQMQQTVDEAPEP
ncbi:MAG TPA: sugar ABC transporter substrate-binding protein [Candidatus Ventrimonas merdavium]|nr:sugar ABC transporter substrate-binding protein [Candidatus Ventrimonas merdavium]